jgi:hypothetical protein
MRLWIDGKRVASAYEDSFTEGRPEAATLELTVGWHDLAVDLAAYQSFAGIPNPHNVGITLTAIPPGGVEVPVTTQMLRPAVASNLASAFLLEGGVALKADSVTPVPISVPAIDGAVIDVVDIGYFMDNVPTPADFTVTLDTGTPPVIPIPSDDFGYVLNSTMFAGQPLPTTPWTMHFADTIADGGPSGAIAFLVFVDFSCHGGAAMPFAPQVTYVSSPLETPNALRFAAVRVKADLDGATVTVSLRTAPSADALASAAWVDVVDGQPPAAVADAFVQYRITTASDGWKYPVIDAVELDYVAPE